MNNLNNLSSDLINMINIYLKQSNIRQLNSHFNNSLPVEKCIYKLEYIQLLDLNLKKLVNKSLSNFYMLTVIKINLFIVQLRILNM